MYFLFFMCDTGTCIPAYPFSNNESSIQYTCTLYMVKYMRIICSILYFEKELEQIILGHSSQCIEGPKFLYIPPITNLIRLIKLIHL